jgi:hypothetical protein
VRGFITEGATVAMADVLEQEGRMLADELGDHTLDSVLQSPELLLTASQSHATRRICDRHIHRS